MVAPSLASIILDRNYGPAIAASGVVTGAARPMNFETVLLPEFVVHTEPEESTATPAGLESEPKPATGDSGEVEL
jgi:hypothetical protein